MYYISSQKGVVYEVTDTSTGDKLIYTPSDLSLCKDRKGVPTIYGLYLSNDSAVCTVLSLDDRPRACVLRTLLSDYRKQPSLLGACLLDDYLATLVEGTELTVGIIHDNQRDASIFTKVEDDTWVYKDSSKHISSRQLREKLIHIYTSSGTFTLGVRVLKE